jgi:NADH-quinone oxidoreductase subunit J
MTWLFYFAAVIAVIATILVITRHNLVHALLYLVVSLFAVAVIFYTLGAPFVAALEVIVYAGAIMMLFLFAVMLLNLRADDALRMPARYWAGPGILAAVLLVELIYGVGAADHTLHTGVVGPQAVSQSLFGPYVLGVELASMLLLAALIGARHIGGRRGETLPGWESGVDADERVGPGDDRAEPADGGTPSPDEREALIAGGGA